MEGRKRRVFKFPERTAKEKKRRRIENIPLVAITEHCRS